MNEEIDAWPDHIFSCPNPRHSIPEHIPTINNTMDAMIDLKHVVGLCGYLG
jgi:hypothetical protein